MVDWLPSLRVIVAALAVALALAWVRSVFQRCPHCQGLVRRVRRGWLRCPRCGRQYHRSVPRQR